VTDIIKVTDSLGNSATSEATVGAALALSPSTAAVPPLGAQAFRSMGGNGGTTFSIKANNSGGSIDSITGAYVAGPTPDTTDVVQVSDSLNNVATATVTVGPGVTLMPASASVAPLGSVTFTFDGGAGGGAFSLVMNNSGGAISSSGDYVAGATGNVVDTVQATDFLGNSASVNVAVGAGLALNPAAPSVPPRGSVSFIAAGGSGGGFAWSFTTNASGGSINATSGVYKAGSAGHVTDVIQVMDSSGNLASVRVTVTARVGILPDTSSVSSGDTIAFLAFGGSHAGYSWALANNVSGATIDALGNYVAGPTSGQDTVEAIDSLGNSAGATVTVTARPSPPPPPTVTPDAGSSSDDDASVSVTPPSVDAGVSPQDSGVDAREATGSGGPIKTNQVSSCAMSGPGDHGGSGAWTSAFAAFGLVLAAARRRRRSGRVVATR
jgi:MYXO-CTERM domain-containing protein